MAKGPVIVGYDGSPSADMAIDQVASVLATRSVLVVVVWEPGVAIDLMQPGLQPAPIDIRALLEVDEAIYERARKLAQQGASRARHHGLDAKALAVADEITVPATLVRLAEERDASAVALGAHGHHGVRELLLGSTTREVIRRAPCPVLVVRPNADAKQTAAERDAAEGAGAEEARTEGGGAGARARSG